MNHDSPGTRALQALKTLRDLDLAVISLHRQEAFEVLQKLKSIQRKKAKSTVQPDPNNPKNARIVKRKNLTSGNSTTLIPQPLPPQPSTILVQLLRALDEARIAIISDLTDPTVEAAVTAPPECVGQDARYLDLKSSKRTPVSRGKRLLARRWVATCYEQWLRDEHKRSRVSELLADPRGRSKSATFEQFFNSHWCQLENTPTAKIGLWEGLKLLVLERLCGWDAVSAIVNYQSTCLKDSSMSELEPLSLAIKNSKWMMEFVKSRPNWLANCQTRYNACYGVTSKLVIQYAASCSKVAVPQPLGTGSASQELEGVGVCSNTSALELDKDTGTLHRSQCAVIGQDGDDVPDLTYNQLPTHQPLSYDGNAFEPSLYTTETLPGLQSVRQDAPNDNGLLGTPFIQLSYNPCSWDIFDPRVPPDVSNHSTNIISDMRYAGQHVHDSTPNENGLRSAPFIKPPYPQ